jgi:uncharacterized circularly permuted ATP-grasp superfamily protein
MWMMIISLSFNSDSVLGVPGIMDVYRAGGGYHR